MSFNDNKPFWTEFIGLYREHRALWDNKSKNYSNKHIRKEGYDALIKKCKGFYPHCDEKFVKSKIEVLRGSFRREFRKVQNSKKTGSDVDDVYEPSLWYYNLLCFLVGEETVSQEQSLIGKRARRSDPSNDEEEVDDYLAEFQDETINNSGGPDAHISDVDNIPYLSTGRYSSTSSRPSSTTTSLNIRKREPGIERNQELYLDAATTASSHKRFRAFGTNVAYQLEDMERHQQVIAEKLIADALFHGKLGNLTPTSSIQTDRPT